VRRAVRADLEAILKEAQALNDESAWCFTWNDDAARAYLGAYIAGGDRDILLVMRDGAIAGGALVLVVQECWDERLALIDKFFIVRRHRRGTASARLAQAAIDWARARGAAHLFLTAAARFSGVEQGLLVRLMQRHGFETVGPCLVRPLTKER
jgi:GNAT superfamily N-acetyltransferase